MPIPSSGAFRIYPFSTQIVSGGFSQSSVGAPPPQATQAAVSAYLAAEVDDPATAVRLWQSFNSGGGIYVPELGVYEIQCLPKTVIVFDSAGTPTPISVIDPDFPLGVRFNQCLLFINGQLDWDGRDKKITNIKFKARNAVIDDITPTGSQINVVSDFFGPNIFQHWGTNQVLGITSGVQATVGAGTPGGTAPNLRMDLFYIQGIYSTGWTGLDVNSINANPGDTITITATNNLDAFGSFKAYWKTNRNATDYYGGVELPIISQSTTTVVLYLPPNKGLPYGGRRIAIFGIVGSGSTFIGPGSSEVLLVQVNATPLLTDGSGIYNLEVGKRNDTYYDRSVSPVITTDLKIPNPYARTGYF